MRIAYVQVRIEDMCKAEEVLLHSWGQRYKTGTRSLSHSVTTLYLYKEGGLPDVQHHSLSGEALLLKVLMAWSCSCVLHVQLFHVPCKRTPKLGLHMYHAYAAIALLVGSPDHETALSVLALSGRHTASLL